MKKLFLLLLLVLLMSSCYVDVDPGYVGVRTYKRGDKAGQIEILPVGRHDWKMEVDDTTFPTYRQNYVWTKDPMEGSENDESITFPIEGLTIGVDVGIEFSVISESVDKIYSAYRMDLLGITDGPMRNYVRDSILTQVKDYSNMESFITNNEISTLITKVEADTKAYFKDKGIDISKVYLVGAPRYPQSVVSSIEQKIKSTQVAIQRENELREAEAEAKKQIAKAEGEAKAELERAKASSEANRLLQNSLTKNIIDKLWIEKWDGHLPEVVSDSSVIRTIK